MLDFNLSRRRLIGSAFAAGALGTLPKAAMATLPEQRIAFRNIHNSETFDARFFGTERLGCAGPRRDQPWPARLAQRQFDRHGQAADAAPRLGIRDKLGFAAGQRFDLISGYRSPGTNAMLRANGGEHTGVASKSQHMLGKATDIRMPGVELARVRAAALSMRAGGVGFYPKDGFVHVDTGRVRTW